MKRRKVIIFHPKMLPVAVLADPELTVGMPRVLTVGTGMDALSHSLEAICAPSFHPMGMGIGMEGCRLVLEHLPRVVSDPGNLAEPDPDDGCRSDGRRRLPTRGSGAMHALSHPIGAVFNTPHGMTNAVVMPYVLQSNSRSIKAVMESLGACCGIVGGTAGVIERVLRAARRVRRARHAGRARRRSGCHRPDRGGGDRRPQRRRQPRTAYHRQGGSHLQRCLHRQNRGPS